MTPFQIRYLLQNQIMHINELSRSIDANREVSDKLERQENEIRQASDGSKNEDAYI